MTVTAPHGQALPDNLPVLTEVVETELPVSGPFSEAEPFTGQHFGAPLDLPPELTQALPPVLNVTQGDALFESLPAIDLELGAGLAQQEEKDEALFSELAPADIWLDRTTPPASVDSLLEDFDFAFDASDPALALSATAPSSSWQSDVPDLDLAALVPDAPLEDVQLLPEHAGLPAGDAQPDFSPTPLPPAFEAEAGHGLLLQPEVSEPVVMPVREEVPEPVLMPVLEEVSEPVVMPMLEEVSVPAVMPVLGEVSESVLMPVLEEVSEPVLMPVLEEVSEPAVIPVLEEVSESVVMPVLEEVSAPVVMPVLEEVSEPVVMPVLEEVSEPVVMPVLEEVSEPVVMPVLEEVSAPVVMPVLEEVSEPVVMPVLEEVSAPVLMPVLEEVSEPVVMPVLEEVSAPAVMPLPDQTPAVASLIEPQAKKQSVAVVDEAALLDAVYQRIVPRMKVELTLWLQDAIEVQSKHMLAGVMQQMKEDYDMLFGETLRESVRQAIADIGQNEQYKDDHHG